MPHKLLEPAAGALQMIFLWWCESAMSQNCADGLKTYQQINQAWNLWIGQKDV